MNLTFEGSDAVSRMDLSMPRFKGIVIGFWIVKIPVAVPGAKPRQCGRRNRR